jgi:hypothetical protein
LYFLFLLEAIYFVSSLINELVSGYSLYLRSAKNYRQSPCFRPSEDAASTCLPVGRSGLGKFLVEENSVKSPFLAKPQRREGFLQTDNQQPTTSNQQPTTKNRQPTLKKT